MEAIRDGLPYPANFLTLGQDSAISPFSGPILEAHATKNRYRRFFFCICGSLSDFTFGPLHTAAGGFPNGFIQEPGFDVQNHLLRGRQRR